jgi:hypothetical protein
MQSALSNGPNKVDVAHPPPEDGKRSSVRNVVFFTIPDHGQSPKNPVIPTVRKSASGKMRCSVKTLQRNLNNQVSSDYVTQLLTEKRRGFSVAWM